MQEVTFFKSIDEVKSKLQLKKAPLKHQFDALNIVKSVPYNQGFLIADEPGLGKTFTCLMLIKMRWMHQLHYKELNSNFILSPSLVIVPLAALEVWKKEVKDVFGETDVFVYYGSRRTDKLPRHRVAVYITTHGTIQSEGAYFLDEKVTCFDAIVVDEGHILHRVSSGGEMTTPKTKKKRKMGTSDAIMSLKSRSKVRYVITGTPFRNKLKDVESIRSFIDPDDELRHSFAIEHTKELMTIDLETMKDEDIVDSNTFAEHQDKNLKEWVKTHMIRRTKEDILSDNSNLVLRKKEIQHHVLNFSPYEQAVMKSLRNDLTNAKNMESLPHYPLHVLGKMRQCCVSDLFIISDGVEWIDQCHERMMKSTNKQCPFLSKEDQKRALNTLQRSTKLMRVIHDLFLFSLDTPTVEPKVIVLISHFVKTLKLIDILLSFKGTYDLCAPTFIKERQKPVRLDTLMYCGDVDLQEREKVLQRAKDVKRPTVLLVSLQSGNSCVDMTFSSQFMFLDRWWTPSTEFQMQERGHRFVTREMLEKDPIVYIHYYTMNNSVEDFQELIQTRKYEQEMEFFGDALQLEIARAKRDFMEQKLNLI